MTCEWTGTYVYQPNTPQEQQCLLDGFCNKIYDLVSCDAQNAEIITKTDSSWSRYGHKVDIETYYVEYDNSITEIETLAEEMIDMYERYLSDEASNFGEYPYYIGNPYSEDDIEAFVYDNLKERGIEL